MNGTPHDWARLTPDASEALEETLSAYALGALPESEAQTVARHLAVCPACREVAADLTGAVALLPAACEPAEPSAALKERILAAARAEQANGAQPVAAPIPLASRQPEWRGPRRVEPASRWPWLLTAAMLLLSASVGLWNAQLRNDLRGQANEIALIQQSRQSWALTPTSEQTSGRGLLLEPEAGGPPVLFLRDLPDLPYNRTYQVWVIRDGQPASAAVVQPGPEEQKVVQLQQGLAGVQTVAVSIEPLGGSPSPTGPIVLAGNL